MKKSLYLIIILSLFCINVLGHSVSLVPKPAKMELKAGSFYHRSFSPNKGFGQGGDKRAQLIIFFCEGKFWILP